MPDTSIRDHLANERTFLAWVRTSIALISFGVVIAKLRFLVLQNSIASVAAPRTGQHSTLLGLAFAAVGVLTLAFAHAHYQHNRRAIETGAYHASGRTLTAFTVVVALLGMVSIAYLLTLSPH